MCTKNDNHVPYVLATAVSLAFAADPSPLQDFCVGIKMPDGTILYLYIHLHI